MAEKKNMALNDEAMANATGGAGEDLPLNKYNEGDRVIVQGYEDWDSTVTEVKDIHLMAGNIRSNASGTVTSGMKNRAFRHMRASSARHKR